MVGGKKAQKRHINSGSYRERYIKRKSGRKREWACKMELVRQRYIRDYFIILVRFLVNLSTLIVGILSDWFIAEN